MTVDQLLLQEIIPQEGTLYSLGVLASGQIVLQIFLSVQGQAIAFFTVLPVIIS